MKKMIRLGVLGAALLAASSGWSYTIGSTDVGGLDTLLNTPTSPANQGDATVLAWINSYINPDASSLDRTNSPTFYRVDGSSSIYAIALTGAPDYFHLFNANHDALFANDGSGTGAADWGVFDISWFNVACNGNNPGPCNSLNIYGATGTISHVDVVGSHASVPEPSSLGLLAAGVLGLVAVRRMSRVA